MDLPGVHNQHRPALSATQPQGAAARLPVPGDDRGTRSTARSRAFARGAWRAREAGLDGVELHAANGYLFTQFLSSGINDRKDEYGGSLANRARFLLDVIQAIRAEVGSDFHLQVKLSAIDRNNVIPWEGKGNTLDDTVQVAKLVRDGRRRRAPRLDRLPVPASAEPAGRLRRSRPSPPPTTP